MEISYISLAVEYCRRFGQAAVERGLPFFVEKPLSADAETAEKHEPARSVDAQVRTPRFLAGPFRLRR